MLRLQKAFVALVVALPIALSSMAASAAGNRMDIVDTAADAGSFNTLIAAVQAAGLEETLRGNGPFTVFAPTDEAFAKLPAGTVEDLLRPENRDKLVQILTFHVVPGKVRSTGLRGKQVYADTVEGGKVLVNATSDSAIFVNGAYVEAADINARNGVIHVINEVLLP